MIIYSGHNFLGLVPENSIGTLYLEIMPWYNGEYPPSYKNQPIKIREKAVEIANELLANGVEEGVAIATGLKNARKFLVDKTKIEKGGLKNRIR